MSDNDKQTLLLTQLVTMLHFAALQQMGKLKNPLTDKIERDLPQAQATIDMLEMLYAKMKGNLRTEEEKLFSSILQEVKLNYVDEVEKPSSPDQSQPSSSKPSV